MAHIGRPDYVLHPLAKSPADIQNPAEWKAKLQATIHSALASSPPIPSVEDDLDHGNDPKEFYGRLED